MSGRSGAIRNVSPNILLDAPDKFFLGGLQDRRRGPDTHDFGQRSGIDAQRIWLAAHTEARRRSRFRRESSMAW